MSLWICAACGVEQADSSQPPEECMICTDERQYVPLHGQTWTTSDALAQSGTRVSFEFMEPGLYRMAVTPRVGIGRDRAGQVPRTER